MTDPISFTSSSPRYGLPFLFTAQAQKEFFVNEALARIDALLHAAIEGEAGSPPAGPVEGECWLVAPDASGVWQGHEGEVACRQGGGWIFAQPRPGMRVHDLSTGETLFFDGSWNRPGAVALPDGGSTVDSEARAAIAELVGVLAGLGILS